jgi:flagellar hook assembly protein FlgD
MMKNAYSIIVLFAISQACFGKVLHVPQDYSTIQGAVGVSSNNDTISIANGTYNENIYIDFFNDSLFIIGESPESTIVQSDTNTISVNEVNKCFISKLRISGGGDGIEILNSKGVVIDNCIIRDNSCFGVHLYHAQLCTLNCNQICFNGSYLIKNPANKKSLGTGNNCGVMVDDNSTKNYFVGNHIHHNCGSWHYGSGFDGYGVFIASDADSNIFIADTLRNNSGGDIGGAFDNPGCGYGVYIANAKGIFFGNCTVDSNDGGYNVDYGFSGTGNGIVLDSGASAIIGGDGLYSNRICDNNSVLNHNNNWNIYNNTSNNIIATNNYWGLEDTASIRSRIFDHFQDSTKGYIIISPYISGVENDRFKTSNRLVLGNIYPNPFNEKTRINYQIKNSTFVHLNIYNCLGNKIKTLINKNQTAGKYSVVWNGRNDSGFKVSTGTYFCSFETNGGRVTKKIVMIK